MAGAPLFSEKLQGGGKHISTLPEFLSFST
jgi:hypothetical protein